ncbi:MAG: response regulator, partial [Stellaceae bacterium]
MKILIVDDHPIVRAGVRRLLAHEPGMEIAEAASGKEALTLARANQFDLVILDLNLPGGIGGFDIIARLGRDKPRPRLLVLSMHDDPVFAMRALDAGADGYI